MLEVGYGLSRSVLVNLTTADTESMTDFQFQWLEQNYIKMFTRTISVLAFTL